MYYKAVKDGYIVSLGVGQCAVAIDAEEHERIKNAIATKPEAPDGYGYHLKEDLTWELYELPPGEAGEELTAEEALAIITGGAV